jgi:hypothetical protein
MICFRNDSGLITSAADPNPMIVDINFFRSVHNLYGRLVILGLECRFRTNMEDYILPAIRFFSELFAHENFIQSSVSFYFIRSIFSDLRTSGDLFHRRRRI